MCFTQHVNEEKIDVIYLANPLDKLYEGVDADFSNKIPEKYFLFVGGREGYKNFMFFVQMFSRLNPIENNLFIVCTGSNFTEAEKFLFKKLNIEKRILCYFLSDAELFFLYSNALALIFPSLYEGFGLPVLEAFSCNCPVLLSDSSSLAEIGNDAVLKFEPKDPMSFLNCLKLVLDESFDRETFIKNGNLRLKEFSWNLTGKKTLETYKKVLLN
ncbi:glycosyltransferase family 1 protein [bacterium]|nr:MAG: glycosyltransferase family 1 protein [bacterium]